MTVRGSPRSVIATAEHLRLDALLRGVYMTGAMISLTGSANLDRLRTLSPQAVLEVVRRFLDVDRNPMPGEEIGHFGGGPIELDDLIGASIVEFARHDLIASVGQGLIGCRRRLLAP